MLVESNLGQPSVANYFWPGKKAHLKHSGKTILGELVDFLDFITIELKKICILNLLLL